MAGCRQDGQALIAEYRGKFPEISEEVLAEIVRVYGSDPESCQKILEGESTKCLYGSSSTPGSPVVSFPKGLSILVPKSVPGTPLNSTTDFIRSNSTGSTGSGQSSGRSTPSNQIPTPWVVPRYHSPTSAGHSTPNHYPNVSSSVPSSVLYSPVDGNYYHPWAGAPRPVQPHNPALIMPGNVSTTGNQQRSPADDNMQATFPGVAVAPHHPAWNPSGTFPVITRTPTYDTSSISQASGFPLLINGAQGTLQGSAYYTMPTNPSSQSGNMYYDPSNTMHGNPPYPVNATFGHSDSRYHTSSGSASHNPAFGNLPNAGHSIGAKIETPYFVPNTGGTKANLGQLYVSTGNEPPGVMSQCPINTNTTQFNPVYQLLPATNCPVPGTVILPSVSSAGGRTLAPFTTNTGFIPINPVGRPNTDQFRISGAAVGIPVVSLVSPGTLTSGTVDGLRSNDTDPESQQLTANDEYLRACLSQQKKRFQNLKKEYAVEKERLDILIQEITERDHHLYKQKYIVSPNPSDEQVNLLNLEIEQLKKTIDQISKNLDRLDNGHDVLPPPDPQDHPRQRIMTQKHREPFDRSISAPNIHVDKRREQPSLRPQLSEQNIQYTLTPDSSLKGWSLVDTQMPPVRPAIDTIRENSDEGQGWSCPKCTFLNHESLFTCEMCGTNQSGAE